jgi:hypothetical protein
MRLSTPEGNITHEVHITFEENITRRKAHIVANCFALPHVRLL